MSYFCNLEKISNKNEFSCKFAKFVQKVQLFYCHDLPDLATSGNRRNLKELVLKNGIKFLTKVMLKQTK